MIRSPIADVLRKLFVYPNIILDTKYQIHDYEFAIGICVNT